jgi:3D-(3,5/4)-trihydroxycyclohexane-1,2-dione acylhydrolase (decyclizing)
MDAHKRGALAIVGDARATLDELREAVAGFETSAGYRENFGGWRTEWNDEVDRIYAQRTGPVFAQGELIGAVNACASPEDVVVCAAGSLPGDLHKLWRSREPNTYHLEYGYSCMGYEIAGGLGVKMADPRRDVFVMVGDGSYLMMAQEIVTSIQEGCKLIIILLDSSGYASIGGLSRSVGSNGFGTQFDYKVPVDLAANAASLGAIVHRPTDRAGFDAALKSARAAERTTVIYAKVDAAKGVPGYESWWDVPVAEVSDQPDVRAARERWQAAVDQRRRV